MQKFRQAFLILTGILLFIFASGKMVFVLSDAKLLAIPNSLFSAISNRQFYGAAAMLEFVLAGIMILSKNSLLRLVLCAWFGCLLLLYRIGTWSIDFKGCDCLGGLAFTLGLDQNQSDIVSKATLMFILLG